MDHTHTHIHARTRARTHAHTRAHAHTHTHTHINSNRTLRDTKRPVQQSQYSLVEGVGAWGERADPLPVCVCRASMSASSEGAPVISP